MSREITFASAVNEAINIAMSIDDSVICYGLGVTDPKSVFGTTSNLNQKYGPDRIFDVPTSENALTGIGIGAAIGGLRPIMVHQRLDFFLLAMDQLVNSAAKWHYMFGSQRPVPITIRLIIGRGWGQGPTHAQNLQAWFSHIPGLKVVMPTTARDAKGLLLSSIFDPNPVIFLENRWLHNLSCDVPLEDFRTEIGRCKKVVSGDQLTIIAMSYLTIEAEKAARFLSKNFNLKIEVINLLTTRPIDWSSILKSVKKTGRVLVLDSAPLTGSLSGEIVAKISEKIFSYLKSPPVRLAHPDIPEPTSFALTKGFYTRASHIAKKALKMLDVIVTDQELIPLEEPDQHDVPGDWFQGPF